MSDSFDTVYAPAHFTLLGTAIYVEASKVSDRTSRNIVALEAAGSNQPTIQDLGRKPTELRVELLLVDANGRVSGDLLSAYGKADALRSAMRKAQILTFHHPTAGAYEVRIVTMNVGMSNRMIGVLTALVDMIVTQERDTVPIAAISPRRALQDHASTFESAAEREFVNNYSPPSSSSSPSLTEFAGSTRNVLDRVENAPASIGEQGLRPFERLSGIYDNAESLRDEVVNVLNNPLQLARDTRLLFDNLSNIDSPRDFAQALFRISEGLGQSPSVFGDLARRLGLGRLVRLLGEYPIRELFTNRPDAERLLDNLDNSIAEEEVIDVEVIQVTLNDYRTQQLPQLPDIQQVSLSFPQPSPVLAYRHYGDTTRSGEIDRGVQHPLIVRDFELRVER